MIKETIRYYWLCVYFAVLRFFGRPINGIARGKKYKLSGYVRTCPDPGSLHYVNIKTDDKKIDVQWKNLGSDWFRFEAEYVAEYSGQFPRIDFKGPPNHYVEIDEFGLYGADWVDPDMETEGASPWRKEENAVLNKGSGDLDK